MTTFPPDVPGDFDDPTTIQAHDWQAFRGLDRMENHWDRPGWSSERRSYHWLLSFHDVGTVGQLVKQCQARLDLPPFDLVPLDTLHLTLGRVGFTDEVPEHSAQAVADRARRRCQRLAPFELTIGPLAGSRGALRFSVAPWTPLLALHHELADATRAVLGEPAVMDTTKFRPHLSIAYAHAAVPVAPLLPLLTELRRLGTTTAHISSVELVELRREGRTYGYVELARVLFGDGGIASRSRPREA